MIGRVFLKIFYKSILNCLVETFLCLIRQASRVKEFIPINLINSVYKILAKVLANRLRKVMPSTISEAQGGFLARRLILNQSLIANETIEDC